MILLIILDIRLVYYIRLDTKWYYNITSFLETWRPFPSKRNSRDPPGMPYDNLWQAGADWEGGGFPVM